MNDGSVISFHDVSYSYNGFAAVIDATFSIGPAESVCIVGPNGGGKTTLLKMILGLLRPTSGSVRVFGQTPSRSRSRIGYMPQLMHFDPLIPVTALDVALMGRAGVRGSPRIFGWYRAADRRAALRALADVEMEPCAEIPFSSLSGGQRQRVLVARALAGEPELLLLDEPTANADIVAETRLFELLRSLNSQMTIATVSHNVGLVSKYVEKVICVNRRVAVHDTGDLTGAALREVYGEDLRLVLHDHYHAREDARHD